MKARVIKLTMATLLVAMLSVLSCSKDKQTCTTCKAACTGTSVDDMNYCGDENSVSMQESSFRASHPGCEVTCNRSRQSGY